jgi:hypothetical protein
MPASDAERGVELGQLISRLQTLAASVSLLATGIELSASTLA